MELFVQIVSVVLEFNSELHTLIEYAVGLGM